MTFIVIIARADGHLQTSGKSNAVRAVLHRRDYDSGSALHGLPRPAQPRMAGAGSGGGSFPRRHLPVGLRATRSIKADRPTCAVPSSIVSSCSCSDTISQSANNSRNKSAVYRLSAVERPTGAEFQLFRGVALEE